MQKYHILVVAALPIEMKTLKRIFKSYSIAEVSFSFLRTWVWNYQTLYELQRYLWNNSVDFILNIGVCGKNSHETSPHMFHVSRIKNFSNNRESLPHQYIPYENLQSIGCSEKIITDSSDMWEESYVDMESYAIDFIAKKYSLAYSIFKIPFDTVWATSISVVTQEIAKTIDSQEYLSIIHDIRDWCKDNRQEIPDWEKYKQHFWFTFTQTEILKKWYYKFRAYGKDFDSFFHEHQHIPKKDFLEKMQQATN